MRTRLIAGLASPSIANRRAEHGIRATRLAVTAMLTALIVIAAVAAPASAATSANQRFEFVFTAHSAIGKAIGTGLVNGVGSVQASDVPEDPSFFAVTVSLPQGDLYLLGTIVSVTNDLNPRTCVVHRSGTDTYTVTGGTGAFAAATGTGADTERGVVVLPKNPDGSCNLDANPIAGGFRLHVELHLT